VVRYGKWLGHFLTGDMGREYAGTGVRGQSIYQRIKDSLPRSLLANSQMPRPPFR